jgi:parallel beta-helix repeat protein
MKRVLVALTFVVMLMVSLLCGLSIHAVEADSNATIYIRADGTVGGTDKIQRVGEVYSLTGDISDSIVVEKDNIVIDGAGYTLQPQSDATVGVDIRDRNNVTIRNLTIRGFIGRCAILLINTVNCDIVQNNLSDNLKGIEMTLRSSRNSIVGNHFENNELGLELYSIDPGSDNLVSENYFENNNFGMVIRDFTNTGILDNMFDTNTYGLFVGVGSGTKLENNTFSNNIYAFGASNTAGADIDTSNSINGKPIYHWVNQHDKTVPADAGYVALIDCSGIRVENLDLSGSYHGVFLGSTINSIITNNKFHSNLFGVNLNAASNNTIIGNIIIGYENGVGLEADSSQNTIHENDITRNNVGVYIDSASGNVITLNNIRDSDTGIYTQYSGSNSIHHNNFIDNAKNWDDTGLAPFPFGPSVSVNMWDDGSEGNYWSDYDGEDFNGDGVGDTPYVLGTNNTDRYPLMNPVAIPAVSDGSEETEPFPTTLIVSIIVLMVVVAVGSLIYFAKLKKRGKNAGI